jgi:hypothetical protein
MATPVPLSPCLSFRCASGGGSMKNSAFSSAVQLLEIYPGIDIKASCCTYYGARTMY